MKKTIIAYALFTLYVSPVFALDLGDIKGVADKLEAVTSKKTQQATPVKETAKTSVKTKMPDELIGKYVPKGFPEGCVSESDSSLVIEKEIVFFGMEGSFSPAKVTGASGKYNVSGSMASEGEESPVTIMFYLSGSNLTAGDGTYVKCGVAKNSKKNS